MLRQPPTWTCTLIVDNYGTHKHPRVKTWLRRHPRFHLHFTPTSSSWLNLVECWFRELTQHVSVGGRFTMSQRWMAAIEEYISKSQPESPVFRVGAPRLSASWQKSPNVKKR